MGHERFLFQLADTDKKITLCLSVRDFNQIHDELVTASSASEPSHTGSPRTEFGTIQP